MKLPIHYHKVISYKMHKTFNLATDLTEKVLFLQSLGVRQTLNSYHKAFPSPTAATAYGNSNANRPEFRESEMDE
jgi:hypothetical protein